MDLFGRVVDLHSKHRWFDGMSQEKVQAITAPARYEAFKAQKEAEDAARREELQRLYQSLSLEQAQAVASEALAYYDHKPEDDTYLAHLIWSRLVNYVPGALAEIHHQLLDRQIIWADGFLFCGAQASIRDHMLDLIDADMTVERFRIECLCGLAWIGDAVVQQRFAAWRQLPPHWDRPEYRVPEYAYVGGWELTNDGRRRNLYYPTCHALIPLDKAPAEQSPGPVAVVTSASDQGTCRWCQRALVTLFDLNLRDGRLHFLGVQGERLRLSMCLNCSLHTRVYTDFDLAGRTAWSGINPNQPPDNGLSYYDDQDVLSLPRERLVFGPPRRTPYETSSRYWEPGLSQLGGMPEWVQDAEYPRCPVCQQTMLFIGQVEPLDLLWEEGMIYAFACFPCGKATTGYQQT
jgi:hypothetical protein